MEEIELKKFKNVHFIGIGGIGVSAIAHMMLLLGKDVSGSDTSKSIITEKLEKEGAEIHTGHNEKNIHPKVDLVVYTIAIENNNSELKEAKKRGIVVLTYPEALGLLTKKAKTIAVAGTHGKTTTTAMIAEILLLGKIDPTVIVGSFLSERGENFIGGQGEYMVVEACEYRDSFLNLYPFIGVITNIDNDHLDYFGSIENIQKSFAKFVDRIPRNGFLICPAKDKIVSQVIKRARCKIIDYEKTPINFHLEIPGEHNIKNANAALAVSDIVGVERKIAISALKKFKGTWRRAEYKGTVSDGAIMYDDYAHHPTEIKTTLAGFRDKFKNKNITVIFQPHLYSRTKLLLNDFAKSFGDADNVIVAPIYAAREKTDPSISNEKLAAAIRQEGADAVALANFETIEDHIKNSIRKDDMIITMGAGDVFKIGEALVK